MKIAHLFVGGDIGGIEVLIKDYALRSRHENIIVLLWGGGLLADEMKKGGIRVVNLHMGAKKILSTVRKLARFCIDEKIDVLVAHHAAPLSHLCLIALKRMLPEIKTIAYAHENATSMYRENEASGRRIRKKILVYSLRDADQVIAISKSVKNSLVEKLAVPENKIKVIYNGVDLKRFNASHSRNKQMCEIIYVGRLVVEKGVQLTLQALAQLPKGIKYRFTVIGDGQYREQLQTLAVSLGISTKIRFLGSRRDISYLLSQADIFVHMPLCEEGFGITVVEAMASGLICVCSANGALQELVCDGVDGFIVDKQDVRGLAQCLINIMDTNNSANNEKIRTKAIEKATYFSADSFVQSLDAVIEHL